MMMAIKVIWLFFMVLFTTIFILRSMIMFKEKEGDVTVNVIAFSLTAALGLLVW